MTDTTAHSDLTGAFEAHEIDPATFHHAQHVQVAFDLLNKYDFIDAASIYAKGIRILATNAGVPQKFNLTITYAFMSLIAERMAPCSHGDFAGFIAQNPDVMSKNALAKWYAPEQLNTETARRIFLLPAA